MVLLSYLYAMDYKEKLQAIFKECPFLEYKGIADLAGMDPSNFRKYVQDDKTIVTEKTYKKIISALSKAREQLIIVLDKK